MTTIKAPVFALDLGNKHVKIKSEHKTKRFPAHVINKYMLGSDKFSFLQGSLSENYDINDVSLLNNEMTYVVGKDLHHLKRDSLITESLGFKLERYETDVFNILLSYGLAELAMDYNESTNSVMDVKLVLGLPTSDFTPTIIKHLMKLGRKQHAVTVNTVTYHINVIEVVVLPQPVGTLYNLLLDDEFSPQNQELINNKVGVIDFGGGTQIFDTIHNFSIDENNRLQKETGTYTLFNRITDKLDLVINPNIFEIENMLRDNNYHFNINTDQSVDLTKEIQLELDQTTHQLIQDTKSIFKNWNTFDTFIFTGGGANLINKEMVTQELPRAQFVPNSEYSNVEGFYKYQMNNERNLIDNDS